MSAADSYLSALTHLTEAEGAAKAQAAQAKGAIWSGALGNIGQYISQIPEQQAKLKEIQNRADLTALEKAREQRENEAQQRGIQQQQQMTEAFAKLPRNPDGSIDPSGLNTVLQGLSPDASEKLVTSVKNINAVGETYRQQRQASVKDAVNTILDAHKPDEPITPEAVQFHLEALKPFGLVNDQDIADINKAASASGDDARPVLQSLAKFGQKPEPDYTLKENEVRKSGTTNQTIAQGPTKIEKPKTWAEIALDAEDVKSPTQAQSQAAQEAHNKIIGEKALNPGSEEYYIRQKYGPQPTPEQVLEGREAFSKAGAKGTAAGDIPVRVDFKDPTTGKTMTKWVPRSQLAGQEFEKPAPGTVENRLASAQAVQQTGKDIIAEIQDPKIAAQLGPAMGRYNSLREFLGDPPPELSKLAGEIESFGLANMGVHGMRSVQGAAQITSLLDRKHTPESLIAAIQGLSGFTSHFLENEGRSSSPAAPKVGDIKTFPNGNKGRWDGSGWEQVK